MALTGLRSVKKFQKKGITVGKLVSEAFAAAVPNAVVLISFFSLPNISRSKTRSPSLRRAVQVLRLEHLNG